MKHAHKTLAHLSRPYRIADGGKFHLARMATRPHGAGKILEHVAELHDDSIRIMSGQQEKTVDLQLSAKAQN